MLGGGFAISAGSKSSKLSEILGNSLTGLNSIHPIAILAIVCIFAETATELTANVAVANIILPVLAEMVSKIAINLIRVKKKKKLSLIIFLYRFSVWRYEYILCILCFQQLYVVHSHFIYQ